MVAMYASYIYRERWLADGIRREVNRTFEGEAAKAYEAFNIAPIIPTLLDFGVIASQALVVLIITLLISIYPILQLLRLDPIKAMRT